MGRGVDVGGASCRSRRAPGDEAVGQGIREGGGRPAPLGLRELEVLELISEGLSNRQIGERLFLSLGTVKSHTHHINTKLETKNRTQAVHVARSMGLLSGGEAG